MITDTYPFPEAWSEDPDTLARGWSSETAQLWGCGPIVDYPETAPTLTAPTLAAPTVAMAPRGVLQSIAPNWKG